MILQLQVVQYCLNWSWVYLSPLLKSPLLVAEVQLEALAVPAVLAVLMECLVRVTHLMTNSLQLKEVMIQAPMD